MLDGCDVLILDVIDQLQQEGLPAWTFTLPQIVLRTGLPYWQVVRHATALATAGYLTYSQEPGELPRYRLGEAVDALA